MEVQVLPALGKAGKLAEEAVLQGLGMQALFWQSKTYLTDTGSFFVPFHFVPFAWCHFFMAQG